MTVIRIACGFDSSIELDALMVFWNTRCAIYPSTHGKDVTAYFVTAADGTCQPYIQIVHLTKSWSLDTTQLKEMELQGPQDNEQADETIEEEVEIQEISSLEFLNSKLKSSAISKVQRRDVHNHLQIVADILKMKYEYENSKLYYYIFAFTIY